MALPVPRHRSRPSSRLLQGLLLVELLLSPVCLLGPLLVHPFCNRRLGVVSCCAVDNGCGRWRAWNCPCSPDCWKPRISCDGLLHALWPWIISVRCWVLWRFRWCCCRNWDCCPPRPCSVRAPRQRPFALLGISDSAALAMASVALMPMALLAVGVAIAGEPCRELALRRSGHFPSAKPSSTSRADAAP